MQFLTSLFGGSENAFLTAALALGTVVVLVLLAVWGLKVSFRASNQLIRRNKRLTIIDSIDVDPKRQLIIVRRDNVEHLILTGGPADVVVEAGIPAEKPGMPLPRRPAAAPPAAAGAQPEPPPTKPAVNEALEAAKTLVATAPPRGPMERLRELAGPVKERRGSYSLRHTGLMRPVSRMEPAAVIPINPDNADRRRIEPPKIGPATSGSGLADAGRGRQLGDAAKAEGK
jgi:flagellar biogenesis protein FliO